MEQQSELFPLDPHCVQLIVAHVHWTIKDGQPALKRIEVISEIKEHKEGKTRTVVRARKGKKK